MRPTRRWCIFWIAWCAFFVVWDVTFMFIDGGWWILFFAFFAVVQLLCGRVWLNRLLHIQTKERNGK